MKTTLVLSRGSLLLAALSVVPWLGAKEMPPAAPTPPADLYVAIVVPPAETGESRWAGVTSYSGPTLTNELPGEIGRVFAPAVLTALKRAGFKGTVAYIGDEKLAAGKPLLLIQLDRWGLNHMGYPECTLSATLQLAAGKIDLGLHTENLIGSNTVNDWFHEDMHRLTDKVLDRLCTKLMAVNPPTGQLVKN